MLQRLHRGERSQGKNVRHVARAWARGEIVDREQARSNRSTVNEAAAAWGLVIEADAPVEEYQSLYLWPENVAAWMFFQQLGTQWRYEDGCRIGLDYPGAEVFLRYECPRSERKDTWRFIREMEEEALMAWQEKREKNG